MIGKNPQWEDGIRLVTLVRDQADREHSSSNHWSSGECRLYSNAPGGYRNEAMTGLALLNKSDHKFRLSLAIAVASFLWTITLQTRAVPEDDVFQQAVNYVFTGKIDPRAGPEIVDRKSCVVVVPEKFGGYARYYLTRFKMDDARISNKYSGREVSYELEVAGDDILVEYLKIDKTTVDYGFKSAHISLPGNIDQIKRALQLIFAEYCKADKPKSPF